MNLDPDDVREFGEADRFDPGDFHRKLVSSNIARGMVSIMKASSRVDGRVAGGCRLYADGAGGAIAQAPGN